MSSKKKIIGIIVCVIALLALFSSPIIARADTVELNNGLNVFYKTSGIGYIPIVFVHGYSLSSTTWDKVLAIMPVQYRSYAIDLRGFGDSGSPDTGYTYNQMADDVAQFLDAMKIKKAILVGHSMGGMILQHFAVLHPDRILALVLTNTFARNVEPKGMSESVQKRIDGYGSKEDNHKVFTKSMPYYFNASNLVPGDLERFVEVGLKASNNALKELLKQIYTAAPIPAEKFNAIKVPTLIVIATHDPFGTMKQAVGINDGIQDSRIIVISHSGHSPMWERPAVWVKGVLNFFEHEGLK